MIEAATATATPATTPAAAAEPDVARNPDGTVDVTAFAAMAQAELAKESDAEDAAIAAREPKPAAAKRGKDGKFEKPEGDKPEPEAPAEKPESEGRVPDSLARAQRLFKEGKLREWLQLTTGQGLESLEQLHVPSKAFASVRRELKQAHETAARVQQQAALLHQTYAPMEAVFAKRDAGDVRGAIEALFGAPLEEVQGKIVASYHKADPVAMQTAKELQQLRAELAKQKQDAELGAQKQTLAQAQEAERKTLVTYLSESDDPRIARVASKQAFVDMVINRVKLNYNPVSRTSIPWSEAAEQAFDELYGGVLDDTVPAQQRVTTLQGRTPENTGRARTPAKRNLDPNRSAEAAPLDMPEPGSREMALYWARKARSASGG
jgi:hypothetical protein